MKYSTLWILTLFLITGLKEKPKRHYFSEFPISQTCPSGSRSAPCKKSNRIIDDIDIRNAFSRLWQKSRTNRSMKERREQGGWIVLNDSRGYGVIPFPEDWSVFPCSIEFPSDFMKKIPKNLVGIVHTHPFFEGDDITGPNVCGEGTNRSYASGGNYEDLQLLVEIATHLSDFCIKSYVIDGSNITSMTVWGQLVYYPKDSFFSL